ncbi:hypothetical protein Hanom_Chr01g00039511 [Helianthus anomalus]
MKRLSIDKDDEELVDKLVDALPQGDWSTYLMILKSNSREYDKLTLGSLIEKLEGHELKLHKMAKMKSLNVQQDVDLYYKGSGSSNT